MTRKEQHNGLATFLSGHRFRPGRHLLFIIALICVSVGQSFFVFGEDAHLLGTQVYTFTVALAIIYIAFGYFNLYYLAPKLLMKNNYVLYFTVLFGLLTLILAGKYLVEDRMLATIGKGRIFNGIALLDGLSNLVITAIGMTGTVITLLFKQWVEDTGRINHLENEKLKNNIEATKSHINPRLLFSIIEYAASQVKSWPENTSAALVKLSEFLRYALYDCKRDKVLLISDIQFIRNYLALERRHRKDDFAYNISTEGNTNVFVPPFQFMPIVQEIVQKGAREVVVLFETTPDSVNFECRVTGVDLTNCEFITGENPIDKRPESVRIKRYLC